MTQFSCFVLFLSPPKKEEEEETHPRLPQDSAPFSRLRIHITPSLPAAASPQLPSDLDCVLPADCPAATRDVVAGSATKAVPATAAKARARGRRFMARGAASYGRRKPKKSAAKGASGMIKAQPCLPGLQGQFGFMQTAFGAINQAKASSCLRLSPKPLEIHEPQ